MAVKRSASVKLIRVLLCVEDVDEKTKNKQIQCEQQNETVAGASGKERQGVSKLTLSVQNQQRDSTAKKKQVQNELQIYDKRPDRPQVDSVSGNTNHQRMDASRMTLSIPTDKQIEFPRLKATKSSGNLEYSLIKELEGNTLFKSRQKIENRLSKSLTDVDVNQYDDRFLIVPQLVKRSTEIRQSKKKKERMSVSENDLQVS